MSALIPFDNVNEYRTTALKRVQDNNAKAAVKDQIMVVTGANGAIGTEIVKALYVGGATVIGTGRSLGKLQAMQTKIEEEVSHLDDTTTSSTTGKIDVMVLDLSDYDSIEAFVNKVAKKYNKTVDVLINCAGIVPPPTYQESKKYGLEVTFQSNFVSTVILTELMMPLLRNSKNNKARIVHLGSMSHADAPKPMKWEFIPSTSEETFGGYNKDYAESKWLLTAYSAALQHKLDTSSPTTSKSTIKSVVADPGAAPDSAMWDAQSLAIRIMARYVFRFLAKSLPQAAGCPVGAVVQDWEDLAGGGYYVSGVSYPEGMRKDASDPEEWKKMAGVLEKALPDKYKKFAKGLA